MKTYSSFYNAAVIITATIILCFMGFYNNFPFTFPDTGTYIFSGHEPLMPLDRPAVYGMFIRYVSMLESLWFVVYVQAFILAYCLYIIFSLYFNIGKKMIFAFFTYIFLITFFTTASINVAQLIPDIFTSTSILIVFILLSTNNLSRWQIFVLFIAGVIGIASHNSHLLIVVALVIVFYLYLVFHKEGNFKAAITRNLKILYPLLFCSLFLNNTISLIIGKGFYPASGSHVFLISHLLDTGLLESYLNEKCKEKEYKICAYKDNMPNDFIWDFEHSPLYKTGGWMANKDEYNIIIKDIITTPKYVKKLVIKSIENGFSQLFTFNGGDTPTMIGDYPANNAIKQCFSDQNRAYNSSLQQRGQLNFTLLNNTQKYVVVLSFFAALLILFGLIEASNEVRLLTLFILSALVINAFVCGCLSGVNARYESRVIWLLPLPILIALFQSKIINRYLHDN